jgi:23S rRNA (adenine2030-N6)-methyltransferase
VGAKLRCGTQNRREAFHYNQTEHPKANAPCIGYHAPIMFSYRHAFHAGNHADVLKHLTWVAMLRYLMQKDTALWIVDTHAGAGLYRLDHEHARTSAESDAGILKLYAAAQQAHPSGQPVPEAVSDYLNLVNGFNPEGSCRFYPGSPWISQALLRPQDRLKLFEVHPTDARVLQRQVEELDKARQIEVLRRSGFDGLRALLPPPSRRAAVLIDPSYEIKTDYAAVLDCLEDAIRRFPTGSYAVWYPVIGRPEAHALARKLKALGTRLQRAWLQAELNVGLQPDSSTAARVAQGRTHGSLRASGMFVLNPPYTLATQLRDALPWVMDVLREPRGATWRVVTQEG